MALAFFGLIAAFFVRETRCKNLWVEAQKQV
jgi:hypothetical protein